MRPSLLVLLTAIVLPLSLTVTGCATTSDEGPKSGNVTRQPDDVVVELVGLEFEPKQIQVPVGKRVVWQWTDNVVHNVISEDFASSKALDGGAYSVRFDRPGTYPYRCTLHMGMDGVVVVTP